MALHISEWPTGYTCVSGTVETPFEVELVIDQFDDRGRRKMFHAPGGDPFAVMMDISLREVIPTQDAYEAPIIQSVRINLKDKMVSWSVKDAASS